MWRDDQRKRLVLENEVLQREGFDQFTVYQDRSADTYWAVGYALANSGRQYRLYIPIPSGYPQQRPPMYVTEPNPLRMYDGTLVSSQGVSHNMHSLHPTPKAGRRYVTGGTDDGTQAFCCRKYFSRA